MTTESLMVAVTTTPAGAPRAEEFKREIEAQVQALGVDREKARELGNAIIAKFRKSFRDV